jgi:hypothetical protein
MGPAVSPAASIFARRAVNRSNTSSNISVFTAEFLLAPALRDPAFVWAERF